VPAVARRRRKKKREKAQKKKPEPSYIVTFEPYTEGKAEEKRKIGIIRCLTNHRRGHGEEAVGQLVPSLNRPPPPKDSAPPKKEGGGEGKNDRLYFSIVAPAGKEGTRKERKKKKEKGKATVIPLESRPKG